MRSFRKHISQFQLVEVFCKATIGDLTFTQGSLNLTARLGALQYTFSFVAHLDAKSGSLFVFQGCDSWISFIFISDSPFSFQHHETIKCIYWIVFNHKFPLEALVTSTGSEILLINHQYLTNISFSESSPLKNVEYLFTHL